VELTGSVLFEIWSSARFKKEKQEDRAVSKRNTEPRSPEGEQ